MPPWSRLALPLFALACGPKTHQPATAVVEAPAEAQVEAEPGAATDGAPAPLVYFAMVDRFANGDPGNDVAIDPTDPHAFHGGDLQGVIDHLDHLQALGVTHLWLSPIFEMRTDKIDEWGAFHGYWVRDLARVEPRFGDEATLRRLSEALHDQGAALVLDMVWNHTDYDAPLLAQHPDWFHDTGDIVDWSDPVQRVTGRVHGLPDLAQEQPAVLSHLAEVSTGWIDRVGVDGYRVDAVGHMPLPQMAALNAILDQHTPAFWTVGEDFSGDPARLAATLSEGGFDAVFDFPLRYAMIDVFCGGAPLGRLASTLSLDRLYAEPAALVTFLDNHDVPRVTTECDGDAGRVEAALAFQLASRGIPALTWGTEVGLPGGEEPDNRRDLPWDAVASADGQARIASVRRRMQLRADWPVLQTGRTVVLDLTDDAVVFGRFSATEAARVTVRRRGGPQEAWPMAEGAYLVRVHDLTVPTDGGPLAVGVTLARAAPGQPAPWASFLEPAPTHTLEVVVEDADPASLRLVGAGPELGHWDPARGVAFDAQGVARVALPGGTAAAFKVVRATPDGPLWPEGADTTLALPWNAGNTRIGSSAP